MTVPARLDVASLVGSKRCAVIGGRSWTSMDCKIGSADDSTSNADHLGRERVLKASEAHNGVETAVVFGVFANLACAPAGMPMYHGVDDRIQIPCASRPS